MLKEDVLSQYDIVEWYSRESASDDLYNLSENDPMLLAEVDGYELAKGRPFDVNVLICDWDKVITQLVIFSSYAGKSLWMENDPIINLNTL